MTLSSDILDAAGRVVAKARGRGLTIATAESCTGGLVAGALTGIDGASDVFAGAAVTYADEAKSGLLGVDEDVLASRGAVSEEVAMWMAKGALDALDADLAVAVTGIAGPSGGSADKPVGLVHFATARRDTIQTTLDHREERFGNPGREAVRARSVLVALAMLEAAIDEGEKE